MTPLIAKPQSTDLNAAASSLLEKADRFQSGLLAYQLTNDQASAALASAMEGARRQKLAERPDSLLSILLLGASGAGKSELLNALAGARIARSHHARPTTTRPTIYAHEEVPQQRLFEFGTTLGHLASDPSAIVRHDRPELRQKILIDAPDIDSFRTAHRQIVLDLLPAVDVVLYVVTGFTYRDDIGWRTVLEGRGHRAVGFVLNKWDKDGRPPLQPGGVDVDEDFLRLLKTGGWEEPLLFRTSAAYWASRRSGEAPETAGMTFLHGQPPGGDEFAALQQWLADGLSSSEIAQIQRRKRRGLWGELAAAVENARPRVAGAQEFPARIDREFQALRRQVLQVLRPSISNEVRLLDMRQREMDVPDTPGPYGQFRRFGRAISQGVVGLRNGLAPSLSKGGRPVESNTAAMEDFGGGAGGAIARLVEGSLQRLAWQARQQGLPVTWLEAQWQREAPEASRAICEAVQAAIDHQPLHRTGWRPAAVRAVAWTLDIVLLVAVVATTYRLGLGLALGQPATAGYVLSFFALIGCSVLLGNTALAILLPNQTTALQRQMERAADNAAAASLDNLARVAKAYAEDLAQLDATAEELQKGINAQIAALQQEIASATDQPRPKPAVADRLFAVAR